MNSLFEPIDPLDTERFQDRGFWHYIKSIRYPDQKILDTNTGKARCEITGREGWFKVWWDNGPKLYVASYHHNVTVISGKTGNFSVKINWLNQGGGIEKTETINDYVTCRDTKRFSSWTFSTTGEIVEASTKSTAEPFGPISWKDCVE